MGEKPVDNLELGEEKCRCGNNSDPDPAGFFKVAYLFVVVVNTGLQVFFGLLDKLKHGSIGLGRAINTFFVTNQNSGDVLVRLGDFVYSLFKLRQHLSTNFVERLKSLLKHSYPGIVIFKNRQDCHLSQYTTSFQRNSRNFCTLQVLPETRDHLAGHSVSSQGSDKANKGKARVPEFDLFGARGLHCGVCGQGL